MYYGIYTRTHCCRAMFLYEIQSTVTRNKVIKKERSLAGYAMGLYVVNVQPLSYIDKLYIVLRQNAHTHTHISQRAIYKSQLVCIMKIKYYYCSDFSVAFFLVLVFCWIFLFDLNMQFCISVTPCRIYTLFDKNT